MRVIGIKIDNYKSFGDSLNVLRFDSEDSLGLIGKNESGKSNTLNALKDLRFFENFNTNIFESKNRIKNKDVIVSIDIEFSKDDFPKYKNLLKNYKSRFTFFKKNGSIWTKFDGCISEILTMDQELISLNNEINKFPARNMQDNNTKIFKEKMKDCTSNYIKFINADNLLIMDVQNKTKYDRFRELIEEYYSEFRKILPKVIYFSNTMIIKNQYSYDNILKGEDLLGLNYLLDTLDFSLEDLKDWLVTNDIAKKQKYLIKFQTELTKFNKSFQKYYKTNKIELLFNIDSRNIEFTVRDDIEKDGTSITNVSERSDGLKWYLSMFIQLYSARKKYKYCLVLVDEPGNSLHVIAQKRLLELLMNTNKYQIIYTTHSPYMIDIDHLENIRLITKDKYTNITNGINNGKKKGTQSFKETITPILQAIGLSLNYNLGPSPNKNNLVVEGITDYLYIKTMLNLFDIEEDKKPNIIPCIGATNESNIASILLGWGYDFMCLFDNDTEGKNEKNKLNENLENGKDILFFVTDEENGTIENLISDEIKIKIGNYSKSLTAKKFSSLVESKKLKVDEFTKEKFKELFIKLKFIK